MVNDLTSDISRIWCVGNYERSYCAILCLGLHFLLLVHAKTFPPTITRSFLLFSPCCRGFALVRLRCLCMQLHCNCWARCSGFVCLRFGSYISLDNVWSWFITQTKMVMSPVWVYSCTSSATVLTGLCSTVFVLVWGCLAGKSQWF